MTDEYDERYMALGRAYSKEMGKASIGNCNCMVRYNGGPQMPAIRLGRSRNFTSPEGDPLAPPTSFEDMKPAQIEALMRENNEVYIGHIFGSFSP